MGILRSTVYQQHKNICLRKGLTEFWLILSASLLAIGMVIPQKIDPSREYQVKAVFLFNFTQFVEWPDTVFHEPQAPLVIGILGEDPFGTYLDETVLGEEINNHPLVIQRYRSIEEIKMCHILFISQTETDHLEDIFTSLEGRSILTVGEVADFTKQGGMIQFVTERKKIQLQINVEATRKVDLTISSKLLRLAEIVTMKKD